MIVLMILLVFILLFRQTEYYEGTTRTRCSDRIVTASVYADPNNSQGLAWTL